MNGTINFDGTLSGSIAGGGGGGSEVSITPTYQQGVKIADYSIDGNEGTIYTPEIEITKYVNSGVKICEINDVEIFTPSCGYIDTLGDSNVEQIGGFSQGANVTPVNVKRVSYTNDVANGDKIGTLTVGDSSFNVYQKPNTSINYSITKQKTGRKWIDGRDTWQISVYVPTVSTNHIILVIGNTDEMNLDLVINEYGSVTYIENGAKQTIAIPNFNSPTYYIRTYIVSDGGSLIGSQYSGKCCLSFDFSSDSLSYYNNDLLFTIEYVEVV